MNRSDHHDIQKMNKLLAECKEYFEDLQLKLDIDLAYLISDGHIWSVIDFFQKALDQFNKFSHFFQIGEIHPVLKYLIELSGVHDTRFMIKASINNLTYSIITDVNFTKLFETLKSYAQIESINILSIGCGSGYQESCVRSLYRNIEVILTDLYKSDYAYDTGSIQIMGKFSAIHKFRKHVNTLYMSWIQYNDSSYELLITLLCCIKNIKYLIVVGDEELCATPFFYTLRSMYYTLIESVSLIQFYGFSDNMKLFVKNDSLIDDMVGNFENICIFSKQLTLEKIKFVLCLYKFNHITNVDKLRKAFLTVGYGFISRKTIRWILYKYSEKN